MKVTPSDFGFDYSYRPDRCILGFLLLVGNFYYMVPAQFPFHINW